MFSRSMSKTIRPHLQPGEELLAAVLAQAAGASAQLMAHAAGPSGAANRADRATFDVHAAASGAARVAGPALARRPASPVR